MVIKKYLAYNINEAMTRIRYELGKDAIIISQRKVRKPGIRGIFSGKMIEVTAAVESSLEKEKTKETTKNDFRCEDEEFKKSLESIKRLMEDQITVTKNEENPSKLNNMILEHNANVENERKNLNSDNLEDKCVINDIKTKNSNREIKKGLNTNVNEELSVESIHKEVTELKKLLNNVVKNNSGSSEELQGEISVDNLKVKLSDLDIDEEFHEEIIQMAIDNSNEGLDENEILRDIFERDILVTNKGLNGRVVLVGPTGVGKTTTIAKLAGRLALVEKKKVGLITIDTYRIGAIEQLKTYAEIMNIPFKVVLTIKEMEEAIETMEDCDVVLIDTTGRSSKNTMQLSELRAFVQKANPNYTNMVISATTKNKDIKSILKGYAELKYDNVIITKLDETTVYGSVYNISKNANKPINFITIGQNVPDDIKISTKEELARFILGEETLC